MVPLQDRYLALFPRSDSATENYSQQQLEGPWRENRREFFGRCCGGGGKLSWRQDNHGATKT